MRTIEEVVEEIKNCKDILKHGIIDNALNEILEIHKAEQRPKGKWEIVKGVLTGGGDPLLICPICKSKESLHVDGIEIPKHWDFCPTCGADMRCSEE